MVEIELSSREANLKVNPEIYPLEVIYSCSYVYLDDFYIKLEGNPSKEILINIKPKNEMDKEHLQKACDDFSNDLITYSDYSIRARDTLKLRETLLQRALFTNDPGAFNEENLDTFDEEEFNEIIKELDEEDEALEDPETKE